MRIEFLGHASFLLTTSAGTRIVTDPFDPQAYPDKLIYRAFEGSADVVTISHDHGDHGAAHIVSGSPVIIKGNGKFMAKEVEFLGVGTYHDDAHGAKRGKNTVMVNAINKIGQSQTAELIFNPAGYHNNVMQNITLTA